MYFMEQKNQEDELFEVLELDVDDMDNVEVNENHETYEDEAMAGGMDATAGKCDVDTRASKF